MCYNQVSLCIKVIKKYIYLEVIQSRREQASFDIRFKFTEGMNFKQFL